MTAAEHRRRETRSSRRSSTPVLQSDAPALAFESGSTQRLLAALRCPPMRPPTELRGVSDRESPSTCSDARPRAPRGAGRCPPASEAAATPPPSTPAAAATRSAEAAPAAAATPAPAPGTGRRRRVVAPPPEAAAALRRSRRRAASASRLGDPACSSSCRSGRFIYRGARTPVTKADAGPLGQRPGVFAKNCCVPPATAPVTGGGVGPKLAGGEVQADLPRRGRPASPG